MPQCPHFLTFDVDLNWGEGQDAEAGDVGGQVCCAVGLATGGAGRMSRG